MEHQKIIGNRDLTEDEIFVMNRIKGEESGLCVMMLMLDRLAAESGDPDAERWASLARTHLETGMMYAVKSIARPDCGLGRKVRDA